MEVKIGVHNATRELTLETVDTPEEIEEKVRAALGDPNGLLELHDERGRRLLIRPEHLTYIELGEPSDRRVGFGTV